MASFNSYVSLPEGRWESSKAEPHLENAERHSEKASWRMYSILSQLQIAHYSGPLSQTRNPKKSNPTVKILDMAQPNKFFLDTQFLLFSQPCLMIQSQIQLFYLGETTYFHA